MASTWLLSHSIELIGYVASIFSAIGFLPQIIHILRTRSVRDISITSYSVLACAAGLWLVYGVLLGRWPIILSNSLQLLFLMAVLSLRTYFLRRAG